MNNPELNEQARILHSDENCLCQQIEPDTLEYLDYQSTVLVTAYNISRFNGKTSCSLRLDYNNETVFRHYNFSPGDRKGRQGLIYQLAQNLHKFPEFIQWDDI